jgi:choline-glycine betaine transporter
VEVERSSSDKERIVQAERELQRTRRWMRIEWAVLAAVIGILVLVLGGSTFTTVAGVVILAIAAGHLALAVRHRRSATPGMR